MPAWGVKSGKGALNEQSVDDLVAYVESIVTTSDKARAMAANDLDDAAQELQDPEVRAAADAWVTEAAAALAAAEAELAALGPATPPADRTTAEEYVEYTREGLQAATEWQRTVREASDGQILFKNNCARCHTRAGRTSTRGNRPSPRRASWAAAPSARTFAGGAVNTQFSATRRGGRAVRVDHGGCAGERGLRRSRHLVGPHAALRRGADRRADRARSWPTSATSRTRRPTPARTGTASRERRDPRLRAHREGPVVPHDPRRPRRGVGNRAVLRLGLPAARHQPRRAPRLPRGVHRPDGVHGDPHRCCGAPLPRRSTRSRAASPSGRSTRSSPTSPTPTSPRSATSRRSRTWWTRPRPRT